MPDLRAQIREAVREALAAADSSPEAVVEQATVRIIDVMAAHYIKHGITGPPRDRMKPLLAAIQHSLLNGADMTAANLAFIMLCDLLQLDPDRLEYRPRWIRDEVSRLRTLPPEPPTR